MAAGGSGAGGEDDEEIRKMTMLDYTFETQIANYEADKEEMSSIMAEVDELKTVLKR